MCRCSFRASLTADLTEASSSIADLPCKTFDKEVSERPPRRCFWSTDIGVVGLCMVGDAYAWLILTYTLLACPLDGRGVLGGAVRLLWTVSGWLH
eukprot:5449816-Amphidinium_carterae.1